MKNFMQGDTICLNSDKHCLTGFFIFIQKWTYLDSLHFINLKGKKYTAEICNDADSSLGVTWTVSISRLVLTEKKIKFKTIG